MTAGRAIHRSFRAQYKVWGNPTNLVSSGWQFPAELEEFALGLVHHSVLRLDDLIDYIHDAVKPRAIATQGRDNDLQPEKLKHPAPRPVIRCWLFEVSSPSCCLLPDLRALAKFQITRCLDTISPARDASVIIMQVAVHEQVGGCQNFWMAKDEFVDRYGLAREIPLDVQELLAVARARQKPRRGGGEHLPLAQNSVQCSFSNIILIEPPRITHCIQQRSVMNC